MIQIFAQWRNDGQADLNVWCRDCQMLITPEGVEDWIEMDALREIVAKHEAVCHD